MNVPVDLGFHLIPALVLAIDLLFFSPPWTIAAGPACLLSGGLAVVYYFWVEKCYSYNKFYPYPIFDHVGVEGRLGLFAGSAVTMTLALWTLQWLYSVVNGTDFVEVNEKPGEVKTKA